LDAAGNPLPAGEAPVSVTLMKASSSRFIALIGTIAILMLYVGFGLAWLEQFATTSNIPDMKAGTDFFYAGLVLFAPNIINKFTSVFSYFK
jgi:hypothetical protein